MDKFLKRLLLSNQIKKINRGYKARSNTPPSSDCLPNTAIYKWCYIDIENYILTWGH